MKVNIQKGFFALLMLLILSSTAKSQEFIKIIPIPKSQDMIIRDISRDTCLVYTKYYDNYTTDYFNVFLRVSENGSSALVLKLPASIKIVKDFEIYKRVVYFCGQDINNKAVMGTFALQGFPNTEVCIWTLPEMYSFNKLDVGELNSTYHVMMTGEAALGSSHIVDAKRISSTQWDFYVSSVLDNWLFDDVAITKSKVVFSARQKPDSHGTLIEFPYPNMSSSILSGVNIPYVRLFVSNEILLKATSTDNYAFMTNTSYGIHMGEASGLARVWQYRFGNNYGSSPYRGLDLAYNPVSNNINILASYYQSCTLHPLHSPLVPVPPLWTNGHKTTGNTILSIGGIKSAYGLFFAAGNAVTLDYLALYRYKFDEWLGCFEHEEVETDTGMKWGEKGSIDIPCRIFPEVAECGFCDILELPVHDECNENK